MAKRDIQKFGGKSWTVPKLERVAKYIDAYLRALKNQKFEKWYIDAFAGTGYSELKLDDNPTAPLFPELQEDESRRFIDGSARIALKARGEFDRYVLVEQSASRCKELEALRREFPERSDRVEIVQEDANRYLKALAAEDWKRRRGVLFLDPFGAQVEWSTIAAVAETAALDVWLLFPLGVAFSRMLMRDSAKIPESWRRRLTLSLGDGWESAFYKRSRQRSFVDEDDRDVKVADFQAITQFFNKRLQTVFGGVASNPLVLRNSTGIPIYLLFFAVASRSPRAVGLALKIANNILAK